MTRRRLVRPVLFTCAVACLALTPAAFAQTAVDWPQYQGGATHPGVATGPEPGYTPAWDTPVAPGGPDDRFGLSSPVIHDGAVIAVGPEEIVAVDAATGVQLWTQPRELGPSVPGAIAETADEDLFVYTEGWGDGPLPAAGASSTPSSSASATASPSASPTAGGQDDGVFEGPSRLVGAPLGDGAKPRWSIDLPEVSRTGVLVVGSLAIVGTNDGTVTAVDVGTGEVAWTAEAGRAMDVTPASDGDTVVIPVLGGDTSGATVLALSVADGSQRWRFAPESSALLATPPAIAGGVVYVGYADRAFYAIDLATGQQRWRVILNSAPAYSPPVPTADAVFVIDVGTYGSQIYALDPATGERRWDHPLTDPVLRVPALALGGAVVTGTIDGDVVAFDAATGDQTFRLAGEGPVRALASDGTLLYSVRGGAGVGLHAYAHDPDAPLTAISTPTDPQPLMMLGAWAAASVLTVGVVLLLGRTLDRRLGPPVFADEALEDAGADEGEDLS